MAVMVFSVPSLVFIGFFADEEKPANPSEGRLSEGRLGQSLAGPLFYRACLVGSKFEKYEIFGCCLGPPSCQ